MKKIFSIKEIVLSPNMPDIDVDVGTNPDTGEGQHTIISYLQDKYNDGDNIHVARVGNLIRYSIKSALRDLANVYDIPPSETFGITKLLNEHISLEDNIKRNKKIKEYFDKYEELRVYTPMMIGTSSNLSIHAGGVVISDRKYPLNIHAPLQRPDENGLAATVWTKKEVEKVGLIKYDILGVKALTQIEFTKKLIGQDKNIVGNNTYEDYPEEQEVFDDIKKGLKHKNIFQFETSLGKKCFTNLTFNSISDIANASGLIRIFGSQNGRNLYEKYKINSEKAANGNENYWKHYLRKEIVSDKNYEICKKIFSSTYGVMIYQEQLAGIINEVSNNEYSFNYGNDVRKKLEKLGNKWGNVENLNNKEDIKAYHKDMMKILDRCLISYLKEDGYDSEWEVTQDFINCNIKKREGEGGYYLPIPRSGILNWFIVSSTYLFSVLHAIAYSVTSYNQMYQKVNYPREFWTSALTILDKEKSGMIIETIRCETDLEVLSPHINISDVNFTKEGKKGIRFGLKTIKSLDKVAEKILYERNKNGKFKNLTDFINRTNPNKTVALKLLDANAFSCFDEDKEKLYEELINVNKKFKDDKYIFNKIKLIEREMDALQINLVHVHPMVERARNYQSINDIQNKSSAKCIIFINKVTIKTAKNGNNYQFLKTKDVKENTQHNLFFWQTNELLKVNKYYELTIYRNNDFYTVKNF